MGLSASMWTSVSGLLAHGNKMNVVGNNIANVSTIGFKGQRMDFSDYLYISGGSASGPVQIGAGVNTYAVIGDFSQGTLESTNSVTDLAIDGNGFFKVRQPNSEQTYYTRAGDFFFNADRQLQNPEGYRLQGWKIDNSTRLTFKSDSVNLGGTSANESAFQGTGTPVDIVLDSWYLEPQRTSHVNFTMGLTSDNKSDNSTSTNSPMTALFDQWDATKNPPLADSAYATSSPIKVYDEGGTAHTLTVYYDQVATRSTDEDGNLLYELEGIPAGYTVYEYCVTIKPEEDMRSYGGTQFNEDTNEFDGNQPHKFYNDPELGTNKNAGMLMTGHMIFDAAGNLVNQTAYTYGANADIEANAQCALDPSQLGSWQATRFSSNGLPVFCANFTGQPLANSVNETMGNGKSQAQDYLIELDFGLRSASEWNYTGSLDDLVADIRPPATNTETRISLATKTEDQFVTFFEADSTSPDVAVGADGKPITAAHWAVTKPVKDGVNDGLPEYMKDDGAKVYENPNIYVNLEDGTRVKIAYDKDGPKTIYASENSNDTMTVAEHEAMIERIAKIPGEITDIETKINANPSAEERAKLEKQLASLKTEQAQLEKKNNDFKEVLVGPDGKPLRHQSTGKKLVLASEAQDKTTGKWGTEVFTWERNLKTVPNSILGGDFQYVDENGEMHDMDIASTTDAKNDDKVYDNIYAISDSGQRLAVMFSDDGLVTRVAPWSEPLSDIDFNANGWDYSGEKLYFDRAVATRTIDYNKDVSTMNDPIRAENSTKAGSSSFITQDAGQNGYASGVLSGTNITADGVVYGYYDNGETVPLYQIALYDFHNLQGLRREGGNLYAQTKESGEARQGVAGEAGFGAVKAYNIEGSNVDLSREFVNMITTQRGFQANSKGITTVDTMLETVIGMKR